MQELRDLSLLKAQRLQTVSEQVRSKSFVDRVVWRYRQLSASYSQPMVWKIMCGWLIRKIGLLLRLCVNAVLPLIRKPPAQLRNTNAESLRYGILITGGLGDALIAARFVRDLQAYLDQATKFDIFFHSPELIVQFFVSIKGFGQCLPEKLFDSAMMDYDFSMRVNQFIILMQERLDRTGSEPLVARLRKLFSHLEAARKPINKFILAFPALDGAFADLAVQSGKKRYRYLHEMMGIPYGGDLFSVPVSSEIPAGFKLQPGRYITIHDGWDNNFKLKTSRPTKSIPLAIWTAVVAGIKQACPHLPIVQIGGKTGEKIPGVDLCLKAQTSFEQSTSLLAFSALHIDAESGLVHLAAALGVRSVVLFGPTNIEWFSYPHNINIAPPLCGNCWWSTDSWMDLCAVGHALPVCTSSIQPPAILEKILPALQERLGNDDKIRQQAC